MSQQVQNSNPKKPNTFIIIAGVLMVLIIAFLIYDRITHRQKTQEVIAQLDESSAQKDSVEQALNNLLVEYDALKTNNDTLNARLEEEQERVKEVMEEIKNVKASEAYKIKQYKQELETLRKIMRSYVVQIDSLNQSNEKLRAENQEVKEKYQQVRNESEQLADQNEELNTKVEQASTLSARGISGVVLSDHGRGTSKASKAFKFKICFTINENPIAEAGLKVAYIRVADPQGRILTESASNLFEYDGKTLAYSAKRTIEYANEDLNTCVYWTNTGDLVEGKYTIDLFIEETMLGTAVLVLR